MTNSIYAAPESKSLFKNKKVDYKSISDKNNNIIQQKKSIIAGEDTKESESQRREAQRVLQANLNDLSQIHIPSEIGRVIEVYQAQEPDAKGLVVHIQDLHTNPEAEYNLANILEILLRDYNMGMVCSEGATGIIDTSKVSRFPDVQAREKVSRIFVNAGELTGEEYLSITKYPDMPIWGIEDKDIYLKNIEDFNKIMRFSPESQIFISQAKKALTELKPKIYTKELLTIDQKESDYENRKIETNDYLKNLASYIQKFNLPIDNYKNITLLNKTIEEEKNIDQVKVMQESQNLLLNLQSYLSSRSLNSELGQLTARAQLFKDQKISPFSFYSYLKDLSLKHLKDQESKYSNLNSFVDYLSRVNSLDSTKLFIEMEGLTYDIKQRLAKNEEEKSLTDALRNIKFLEGFFSLKISNEELDYYLNNKESHKVAFFKVFLSKATKKYNVNTFIDYNPDLIDSHLQELEDFYNVVKDRDVAMVDNSLAQIEKLGSKVSSLIAGGFHTKGITKLLKDRGYSYIVVSPYSKTDINEENYHALLTGKRMMFIDVLSKLDLTKIIKRYSQALRVPLMFEGVSDEQLAAFLTALGIEAGDIPANTFLTLARTGEGVLLAEYQSPNGVEYLALTAQGITRDVSKDDFNKATPVKLVNRYADGLKVDADITKRPDGTTGKVVVKVDNTAARPSAPRPSAPVTAAAEETAKAILADGKLDAAVDRLHERQDKRFGRTAKPGELPLMGLSDVLAKGQYIIQLELPKNDREGDKWENIGGGFYNSLTTATILSREKLQTYPKYEEFLRGALNRLSGNFWYSSIINEIFRRDENDHPIGFVVSRAVPGSAQAMRYFDEKGQKVIIAISSDYIDALLEMVEFIKTEYKDLKDTLPAISVFANNILTERIIHELLGHDNKAIVTIDQLIEEETKAIMADWKVWNRLGGNDMQRGADLVFDTLDKTPKGQEIKRRITAKFTGVYDNQPYNKYKLFSELSKRVPQDRTDVALLPEFRKIAEAVVKGSSGTVYTTGRTFRPADDPAARTAKPAGTTKGLDVYRSNVQSMKRIAGTLEAEGWPVREAIVSTFVPGQIPVLEGALARVRLPRADSNRLTGIRGISDPKGGRGNGIATIWTLTQSFIESLTSLSLADGTYNIIDLVEGASEITGVQRTRENVKRMKGNFATVHSGGEANRNHAHGPAGRGKLNAVLPWGGLADSLAVVMMDFINIAIGYPAFANIYGDALVCFDYQKIAPSVRGNVSRGDTTLLLIKKPFTEAPNYGVAVIDEKGQVINFLEHPGEKKFGFSKEELEADPEKREMLLTYLKEEKIIMPGTENDEVPSILMNPAVTLHGFYDVLSLLYMSGIIDQEGNLNIKDNNPVLFGNNILSRAIEFGIPMDLFGDMIPARASTLESYLKSKRVQTARDNLAKKMDSAAAQGIAEKFWSDVWNAMNGNIYSKTLGSGRLMGMPIDSYWLDTGAKDKEYEILAGDGEEGMRGAYAHEAPSRRDAEVNSDLGAGGRIYESKVYAEPLTSGWQIPDKAVIVGSLLGKGVRLFMENGADILNIDADNGIFSVLDGWRAYYDYTTDGNILVLEHRKDNPKSDEWAGMGGGLSLMLVSAYQRLSDSGEIEMSLSDFLEKVLTTSFDNAQAKVYPKKSDRAEDQEKREKIISWLRTRTDNPPQEWLDALIKGDLVTASQVDPEERVLDDMSKDDLLDLIIAVAKKNDFGLGRIWNVTLVNAKLYPEAPIGEVGKEDTMEGRMTWQDANDVMLWFQMQNEKPPVAWLKALTSGRTHSMSENTKKADHNAVLASLGLRQAQAPIGAGAGPLWIAIEKAKSLMEAGDITGAKAVLEQPLALARQYAEAKDFEGYSQALIDAGVMSEDNLANTETDSDLTTGMGEASRLMGELNTASAVTTQTVVGQAATNQSGATTTSARSLDAIYIFAASNAIDNSARFNKWLDSAAADAAVILIARDRNEYDMTAQFRDRGNVYVRVLKGSGTDVTGISPEQLLEADGNMNALVDSLSAYEAPVLLTTVERDRARAEALASGV